MVVLIQNNLAGIASDYNSKGETTPKYAVAPEVLAFIDEYLEAKGLVGSISVFDQILESKHQLYNQLKIRWTWGKAVWTIDEMRDLFRIHNQDLLEIFIELKQSQALGANPSEIFVTKPAVFQEIATQNLFLPLVNKLLRADLTEPEKIATKSILFVSQIDTLKKIKQLGPAFEALIDEFGDSDKEQ